MSNEIPKDSADEMTPALRKALVECGVIIPTTSKEVELAEAHLTHMPTPEQVEASFKKLEQMLAGDSPARSFMRLRAPGALQSLRGIWQRFTASASEPESPALSPIFCGDSGPGAQGSQRGQMDLRESFADSAWQQKVPWAGPVIQIMKVPVSEEPGMVRYRVRVEQVNRHANKVGILRVLLKSGDQTDEVRLQWDMPSKLFLKVILPSDAVVEFCPVLG
jgi:hypothetical protein